jgi:hypothetical protein
MLDGVRKRRHSAQQSATEMMALAGVLMVIASAFGRNQSVPHHSILLKQALLGLSSSSRELLTKDLPLIEGLIDKLELAHVAAGSVVFGLTGGVQATKKWIAAADALVTNLEYTAAKLMRESRRTATSSVPSSIR